ncbi:hypothetical protein OAL60_00410 [bacterium]|nr:hypothetical protein [bacterium]
MFGYGWVITTKGLTRNKVLATEENPTHHAIQLVNALSVLPNAPLKEEIPIQQELLSKTQCIPTLFMCFGIHQAMHDPTFEIRF